VTVEMDGIFVSHSTKRTLHRLCVVKSYKRAVLVDNYKGKLEIGKWIVKFAGFIEADMRSVCIYGVTYTRFVTTGLS